MRNRNKNNIISHMFDVRPVDEDGVFDLEKIRQVEKIVKIAPKEVEQKMSQSSGEIFSDIRKPDVFTDEARRFQKVVAEERTRAFESGRTRFLEKVPIEYEAEPIAKIAAKNLTRKRIARERFVPEEKILPVEDAPRRDENRAEIVARVAKPKKVEPIPPTYFEEIEEMRYVASTPPKINRAWNKFRLLQEKLTEKQGFAVQNRGRLAFSFAAMACVIFFLIFGTSFAKKGLQVKGLVLGNGQGAYVDLVQAKEEIMQKNFQGSELKFNDAYGRFDRISQDLNGLGGALVDASRFVPFASKLSTGAALAQVGKDVSKIGVLAGRIMQTIEHVKNSLGDQQAAASEDSVSLLKIFQDTNDNAKEIQALLVDAQDNINKINVDDLPEEQRAKFVSLKNQLPELNKFLAEIVGNSHIFTDALGGNGPRKYLFLFQNNQEMRATGGFIGTYGVLDIFNGHINKFFIDGIFNPDGQLREKVVPPEPIQKISAAWSLHDSNWFPNFPTSAEKATWFYEKTGGPTVDGVITMTPAVMQKLLAVTGPIDLPDYDVIVDKDNFVEKVQQEVEVDYDKELNQPKKILADLAPKILDRIFNARNFSDIAKTLNILNESLNEKQILIYSKNFEIEKELSALGWSGEVLNTGKDYLSVINTNINGYKTDGMIDEKIEHQAEIQEDGTVIDTVTVTRHHKGGNEDYDFWNRVNADYMRVYVPKGSQLLSAEGQTREFVAPPLDYAALNFKRDAQVQMEKDSMRIDEASGTTIYDDSEKTVFANWVYVSPQETVTIKYKYVLPFKVELRGKNNPVETYSLLAQKQSGSLGSQFISRVAFPENYKINWKYPDGIATDGNKLKLETDLKTDKFIGIAFTK